MIWKQSPSIELLELSDTGLARNKYTGRIYKYSEDRFGYYKLNITIDRVQIYNYAHRLICEAFHGPSELTVDHINGIRKDNRPDNLRWLSRYENTYIATKGLKRSLEQRKIMSLGTSGEKSHHTTLTNQQVKEIKRKLMFDMPRKDIMKEYGVTASILSGIKSGKNWKYV